MRTNPQNGNEIGFPDFQLQDRDLKNRSREKLGTQYHVSNTQLSIFKSDQARKCYGVQCDQFRHVRLAFLLSLFPH